MWDNNLPTLTEFHIRLEQLQIPAIDTYFVNGGFFSKKQYALLRLMRLLWSGWEVLQLNLARVNQRVSPLPLPSRDAACCVRKTTNTRLIFLCVPITEILRYAQNNEYGRWRTQHATSLQIMGRGKEFFCRVLQKMERNFGDTSRVMIYLQKRKRTQW